MLGLDVGSTGKVFTRPSPCPCTKAVVRGNAAAFSSFPAKCSAVCRLGSLLARPLIVQLQRTLRATARASRLTSVLFRHPTACAISGISAEKQWLDSFSSDAIIEACFPCPFVKPMTCMPFCFLNRHCLRRML